MFKPVRMERILVGGHQAHMERAIQTLQEQGVVHLEDYDDSEGITSIGSPLHAGDLASELLLHVRGLQRAIGAEKVQPKTIPVPDEGLKGLVDEAHEAITPAVDQLGDMHTKAQELRNERAVLEPFRGLDVDLEAMHGLESLRVLTGFVNTDPSDALQLAGVEADTTMHRGPSGLLAVVVVRAGVVSDAERALAGAGFRGIAAPVGTGTPSAYAARVDQSIADAVHHIEDHDSRVAALNGAWGGRLAALESILQEDVARTQAPLHFGVTANTFHLEGWVPRDSVNQLENVLTHAFGDSLYVARLGDAPRGHEVAAHGEAGHHHHEHEAHSHDDHHEVAVEDEAPTELDNPGPAKNYQFLLSLLAMPRYREIDPTKLLAFFFPLYFGLMVGDVIIGLLIVGVALWLQNHKLFGIGGGGVAKPMMWGGIWAVFIGLLVFGEGLGMHFVISEEASEEGEYSWETAFGMEFSRDESAFLHVAEPVGAHGAEAAAHPPEGMTQAEADAAAAEIHSSEAEAFTTYQAGTAEETSNIFTPHEAPHLSVGGLKLGIYSKIHDIQALLVWSVLIGVVHLALGFSLGIRNIYTSHGLKLAIQEKASWLMIMVTIPLMIVGNMSGSAGMFYGGLAGFLLAMVLLWQGVAHTLGAGWISILEVPGLMGNLLSYTRLAAIGASKAGMAVAFAIIGFDVIGGAAGMIFYLLSIIVITLLAILAGFLQSLRLQFVEFFSKFYEGGGRTYLPFGRRAPQPPSSP
jgi:V/A-type H+-transporting ATPase subunit I